MHDEFDIAALLFDIGFRDERTRATARAVLERAKLTNPSKSRISSAKLKQVRRTLEDALTLCCDQPACRISAEADHPGKEVVDASSADCEQCSGSANARAANRLLPLCVAANVRRIVVVGGSPGFRHDLKGLLGHDVELRLIDGTGRRSRDQAVGDLEWADLVVIAGSSELDHRISNHYTDHVGPHRRKVLQVRRRGVGAVLDYASRHLELQRQ